VLPPITARYLLLIPIKCYRDKDGRNYVDELWQKDLQEHVKYLTRLTLACPSESGEVPQNCMQIGDDITSAGLCIIDLPNPKGFIEALIALPATLRILWKAVGDADIVHSSVAGWPIPFAWLVVPIAKLRRKMSIIIVESAFWRLAPGERATLRGSARAILSEILNRWCVNRAELSIFTQDAYRSSLLTKEIQRGYVINASWIDEENVLSEESALQIWKNKQTNKLRLLFAGRLVAGKGVLVLLEAIKLLERHGVELELDILGEGELSDVCREASRQPAESVKIRTLGTVAYGAEFRRKIQGYHAMVVPNITDEQPRIVYDAFSQAVPVLASDTDGLRACVIDEKTGKLIKANDSLALAHLLQWAANNLSKLESMGIAALDVARLETHQEMHRRRWLLLHKLLTAQSTVTPEPRRSQFG
jgi:glycosyltransferase involved in cell wall biosynthesis